MPDPADARIVVSCSCSCKLIVLPAALLLSLLNVQAQSEAHWRDLAQVKEQATLKEKELLAKNEALSEQLKVTQSKVSDRFGRASVVRSIGFLSRRLSDSCLEEGLPYVILSTVLDHFCCI